MLSIKNLPVKGKDRRRDQRWSDKWQNDAKEYSCFTAPLDFGSFIQLDRDTANELDYHKNEEWGA